MAAIISNNTNSTHTKLINANFVDDIEILKNKVNELQSQLEQYVDKYNRLKSLVAETIDNVTSNSGRIDGLTTKTNTINKNLNTLKLTVEALDSKYYPINSIYMTTAGINPKDVLKFGEWLNIGPVPGAPEDLMVWKRMK